MPSSSKMWQHCRWQGVCRGRQSLTAPHPSARAACRVPISSPLLWGRHWPSPRVRLSARAKGKGLRTQEMVVSIECHPRPRTLLQGCDSVCLLWLGWVNTGLKNEARASKGQETPALPQLFFPDVTERTPKALLRKQQRSAVRAKLKTSAEA